MSVGEPTQLMMATFVFVRGSFCPKVSSNFSKHLLDMDVFAHPVSIRALTVICGCSCVSLVGIGFSGPILTVRYISLGGKFDGDEFAGLLFSWNVTFPSLNPNITASAPVMDSVGLCVIRCF